MIVQLIARKTFKVTECFLSNKISVQFSLQKQCQPVLRGSVGVQMSGVKAYKWLGVTPHQEVQVQNVSRSLGPFIQKMRRILTQNKTKNGALKIT